MELLNAAEMKTSLSLEEACYGTNVWVIQNTHRSVGFARRGKGFAKAFPGYRHRVPMEVSDMDDTTLCIVRRSRAPKSLCKRYRVLAPSGELLGKWIKRSIRKGTRTTATVIELQDGLGRVLASQTSPKQDGAPEWVSDDGRWSAVTTEIRPEQDWHVHSSWSVSGLGALSDKERLLMLVAHLVIGPWSAGESLSSTRNMRVYHIDHILHR